MSEKVQKAIQIVADPNKLVTYADTVNIRIKEGVTVLDFIQFAPGPVPDQEGNEVEIGLLAARIALSVPHLERLIDACQKIVAQAKKDAE